MSSNPAIYPIELLKECGLRHPGNEIYPCNYHNMVIGAGTKIQGTKNWYSFSMQKGAKLYVGGLKKSEKWWIKGPPQGTDTRRGPFFTTVIKRAEAFKGYVLEYEVKTNTALVFTGAAGGWETQEEVFNKGYIGYFACKECEVSVTNAYAATFVDWENVRDISDIVFGDAD
jgi:hypothetical protein